MLHCGHVWRMVSSSVSSSGKDAPHSQLPMIAFVVFPPTFRDTRVTFGIGLAGVGVGSALGGGAAFAAGGAWTASSALPRLSPSVFIAARERTIETLDRRFAASMLTTKSNALPQVGQATCRLGL